MKILIQYLKGHKPLIALALLLATINQVFSLLDPFIYGKLIDRFAQHPTGFTEDTFVRGVATLVGAAIGVAMVSRIAKAFQDYTQSLIIQKVGVAMYTDGLKHSLSLQFREFEDQRSGETLSILQKVRSDSEKLISNFINVFFTSLVGIVFVLIYSIQVYVWLIPVYFAATLLLGYITSILSKRIKAVQKNIVRETNILAGSTTESLRNIELIKSLGLTNQEIIRLNDTSHKILKLELKKVKDIRSISFVQGTFVNLLRQTILFMLMYLLFHDKVTLGQLMTLQFYSFFIFGPLQEIGNVILSYREAETSLNNFERIMQLPAETAPKDAVEIGPVESLRFEAVGFKHRTAMNRALHQINFEAHNGETIAFVGPSGSGKTTLVKLLVGLYKPDEGEIYYNGISSNQAEINSLRNQIGFVTQDTQLFSGSIKENLQFVNPEATDHEIMDVLQKAACQSLLARSDKGIDTLIGEGGMKISGGEKQRLSIARALLRHPKLMVFDEATSALDSLTEEEITNTIRSVSEMGSQITVIIAHRLSTIMHANRIIVLEKGEIAETGTHESLLLEKGLYYAMWRQQIGERKEEMATA
ncbi:MAG: ABC transporter ATP-binding protein [Bacteroidia bacterium]|jgi:ATP-binding cassette subfamily B protein